MPEPRIDHWVCADGCRAASTPGMAHTPACRPIYAKDATGGPAEPESASDRRTEAQTGTSGPGLLPVGLYTDLTTPVFDDMEIQDWRLGGTQVLPSVDLVPPEPVEYVAPDSPSTARLLFGIDIDEQARSIEWLEALHQALGDAIARLKATLPTDAP